MRTGGFKGTLLSTLIVASLMALAISLLSVNQAPTPPNESDVLTFTVDTVAPAEWNVWAKAVDADGHQDNEEFADKFTVNPYELIPGVKRESRPPFLENEFEKRSEPVMQPDGVGFDSYAVYNPAAVYDGDNFYLFYRAQTGPGGTSRIGMATSEDGINFQMRENPVIEPTEWYENGGGCEDPRVVRIGDEYWMTYTAYDGTTARLALARSENLENWEKRGLMLQDWGWSKAGGIVPEKINGKYYMYFEGSSGGGDLFYATSENLENLTWTVGGVVMERRKGYFDQLTIEAGPSPIILEHGILLIYNSLDKQLGEGGRLATGWVMFSREDPTKIIARCEEPFLVPEFDWENSGQVPNCVFAEGLVEVENTWYLYYGAADNVVGLATAPVRERSVLWSVETQAEWEEGTWENEISICKVPSGIGLVTMDACGWWRFDEGTGTVAYDASGFGNDGTISGDFWTTAGKSDNALEFSRVDNDYVSVGDKVSLEGFSEGLTISAWIYPYSKPQNSEIVKKDLVYLLRENESEPGTTTAFMVWDSEGNKHVLEVPGRHFPNNEWTMITATWDGYNMRVYKDNAPSVGKEGAYFDHLATSSDSFFIGNDPVRHEGFDGMIDEVMVFSRALTEDEIRYLYNHPGLSVGVQSGEWTSAWQDFVIVVHSENLEVLASVSAGENAWVAVEVSKDGSSVEDNLGWLLLENGNNTIDLSTLSEGRYARVKFRLETDNMSHSPSVGSFTLYATDAEPPTVFKLLTPADNAEISDNTPTLTWQASSDLGSGLSRYEVWLDGSNVDNVLPDTTTYMTSELPAGFYTWYVAAVDGTGNRRESESEFTFTITPEGEVTPPEPFELLLPENNASISDPTPTLVWEKSSDNESGLYHYQIWLDGSNFDNLPPDITTYTTPELSEGTHTWYVVAVDYAGNQQPSKNVFNFTIGITPPTKFDLLSPNGSWTLENRLILSWENSSGTSFALDHYEVWLDGSNVDNVAPNTTTYTTPELLENTYIWYVVAVDQGGNWRRSENVLTFGVGTPPAYPRREFSDGFESGNLDNYVSSDMEITHSALIDSYSAQWTGTGTSFGYAYVPDVELGMEEGEVSVIFTLDDPDTNPLPGVGFATEDGTWVYAVADNISYTLRVERRVRNYSIYDVTPEEWWRTSYWSEDIVDGYYVWGVEEAGYGSLSQTKQYKMTLIFSRRSKCVMAFLEEVGGANPLAIVRTVVDVQSPKHPLFLSRGPARFDNFHFDFVDTWYYEWEVDLPYNPVLTPSGSGFDSMGAFNPGVWYKDGVFYMLYRASVNPSGAGQSTIGLAKSTDGFHFTKYGEVIDRGRQEEDPELIWPEGADRFYAEYTDVAGGIDSYLDESLDNGETWTNVSAPMAGGKVVSIIDTWMWPQLDEINWKGTDYRYFVTREDAAGITVLSDSITGPWVEGPNNGVGASKETWSDFSEPAGDGFVDADGNIRIITCASTAEGYVEGPEATLSTTLWSGTNPGNLIARGTIPWCPVYYGAAPGGAIGDAWNDGPNFPGQTILVDNWLWCYYGANDTCVGLARCYYGPVFEYRDLMLSKGIVDPKEPVVASLVVRNVGSVNGEENVRLYIDGQLKNSQKVTLKRDEETTVEFTVTIDEGGVYAVQAGGMSSTLWVVPPMVVGTTPENGAKALVNQDVVVRFNKSMDASVTPTLTQMSGSLVIYTFSGWSADDTVATWTHEDWEPDETITLTVSGYKDLRGNVGESYTWSFTTSKGAMATGPTGYSNTRSVAITYIYSGSPDNVKIYYTTDGGATWILAGTDTTVDKLFDWTVPGDNIYWWAAVAIGMEEDPHTGEAEAGPLVIDTVPPPPPENLTANPSGWTSTNSFTISWTNPPDLSGIAGGYYKLNAEPTAKDDGTFVKGENIISISGIKATRQGLNTIYVWLKDKAGNADHKNRSSCVLRLDNVAPRAFKLISPENNEKIFDNTPTLIWENSPDNESGLSHYEVWINDNNVDNVPAENDRYTTPPLLKRIYRWYVVAVDGAGNRRQSENVFTFNLDNIPPRPFKLISPENNATIDDPTPTLTWEKSSDNESGLSHYEVWINDNNVDNVPPERTSYVTSMLSEGLHWWYVVAVDNAVNRTRSDNTFTFAVGVIHVTDYVDPFIGTMYGHTNPGSAVPFAMTTWDPVRKEQASGIDHPYDYDSVKIAGFRGSHFPSGAVMSDYACITIMPESGNLVLGPDRASSFSHQEEEASPGYYAVTLSDYGIRAELTSTVRAGLMEFKFSQSDNAHILVDTHLGTGYAKILPDDNEIVGYSDVGRYRGPTGEFKGYFVIKFDKSFSSYGTWDQGNKMHLGEDEVTAYNSGAWVTFSAESGENIMAKASISFISIDQARANLDSEIPDWDFDRVRRDAEKAWENVLGKIEVVGGSEDEKKIFYTALYHSLLLPRVSSEGGQYYSVFDGQVHSLPQGHEFYNDFSMWDTHRSQNALLILLYPDRVNDMCQSLVYMYEQGGWMPKWPNPGYSSIMIGTHGDSIIAESYLKGITGFDIQKAYEGMVKNATETPPVFYEARTGIDDYMRLGYAPADGGYPESCSLTLEYAYDDWCIAQLAKALGKDNDYYYFMNRATYYRNVFDNSVGFVRGRNSDGEWAGATFDPRGFYGYMCQPNEGNPWQYTWLVPHDVRGLRQLIDDSAGNPNYPGDFNTKLETLLQESEEARLIAENQYAEHGTVRYYWHGNEPGMHIPYLFNYIGEPWRTQFWVDNIMKTRYRTYPYGLPGNDDGGQISSWYVSSAMGFYPANPTSGTYVIGRPIFDKVTIHLGNGNDFVIEAQNVSDESMYIQSATLNGEPIEKPWFEHSELAGGGKMTFVMGTSPNYSWGSDPEDAPPSMSDPVPVTEFMVENLRIYPQRVYLGENVTISVDVANVGENAGTKSLTLMINNGIDATKNVVLEPGESKMVSFEVSRDVPGVYEVRIENLTGSFVVEAPGGSQSKFPWLVAVIGTGVLAASIGGNFVFRRRSVLARRKTVLSHRY